MEINTYTIVADNLSLAQAKIEKMNKRARKLGVPELVLTVVEGSEQFIKDGNDTFKKIDVTLTGETVKLAGWHFAATIQHTEDGNIVRSVPGQDIDTMPYRTVEPLCEHCNQLRRRNDTYIVVNDEGETKQVGSSCLRDFLGVDPASALWMAQFLIDLDAEFESEWNEGGGRATNYMNIKDYLAWVSASIRNSGWMSRSKARWSGELATADDAMSVWDWKGKGPRPYTPDEKDVETAEKALEWIRSMENAAETANDYIYNLYVSTKQNYITWRETGLVASLVQAYSRQMEQEIQARKEAAVSEWVGEIKQRREFTLTVESVRYNDGMYGVTYQTKMVDADGNVFMWWASKELDQGETYTGKATVKDHTEYNGVKQTVINRFAAEKVS